jgi:hypothetical protein
LKNVIGYETVFEPLSSSYFVRTGFVERLRKEVMEIECVILDGIENVFTHFGSSFFEFTSSS